MKAFPLQTGLTIATLAALLPVVHRLAPAVKNPQPAQFAALAEFTPERTPISPLVRRVGPEAPLAPAHFKAAPFLLDDSDGALDHFYHALWLTERHENNDITRIVHYGDSPTTADLITGDTRRLLQKQFGDAGHGFILVAKPWAWYQHDRVQVSGSGWQMVPASHFEARDGMFGLGGVSFAGANGASSRIVLQSLGHTHFAVWFLRQPGGGTFTLSADGTPLGSVDTGGDSKEPGLHDFSVASGATTLELHVDRGPVRLFGITAEKPGPGVVYDSLGLNGASITVLSRMFGEQHWAEELRLRKPDLVILNYGTNEADFAAFVDKQYQGELREAIRRLRAALPQTSILVMSPMDRGHRNRPGEIETMATIPRIVAVQRRVARETGCGFFDTFTAMGGEGTMSRWYTAQPRLVSADLIHPYPAGGKMIATIFAREIASGLNRYKLRQVTRNESAKAVR